MINVQTESFRGYEKGGEIASQTAVECKFGGEVERVLASHASVTVEEATLSGGEVKYTGKVHFILVYEDGDKKICRAEKGVEFSAKSRCEGEFPSATVRAKSWVEKITCRREGASLYVVALVSAWLTLYAEKEISYLTEADMVVKREQIPMLFARLCSAQAEAEDEFETECIGDLLLHSETVHLTSVTAQEEGLCVEGELNVGLLALKDEGAIASFERLVPFRFEVPCEGAKTGCFAEAKVEVKSTSVTVHADEERGKCRILAEFALVVEGCVYEEVLLDAIVDGFSKTNEVALSVKEGVCEGVGEMNCFTERISGKAALSNQIDFSDTLQAVVLQRAEVNVSQNEGRTWIEGIALSTLLVRGADGERRGIEMSLPFSVPVQEEGDYAVSVMVCGTSARQRQEGEIDGEATVKICLFPQKQVRAQWLCAVEEGMKIEESDSAISVYLPRAGDGLWELAKSLKKAPEEVQESNPDIEYPIREGQRVVVYRKKTLEKS